MDFDLDALDNDDPAEFVEAGGDGGEAADTADSARKKVEAVGTFSSSEAQRKLEESGVMDESCAKAVQGILQRNVCLRGTADTLREWCETRFTSERWLDENEREWYALDRLLRSRPWAKNKEKPFPYLFRAATNAMRTAEGPWVGDNQYRPKDTRGNVPHEVISQIFVPEHFPPAHRVLLFCPEFGSESSFDAGAWSRIAPEGEVDLWTVCWEGWNSWKDMVEQVALKVLSFADGVNTAWYGQGMGAIVAFEVVKHIETAGHQTPNLPTAFVVADCPAPHLFQEAYRPYEAEDWGARVSERATEVQGRVAAGIGLMRGYRYAHARAQAVLYIPIRAVSHAGEALAPKASVEAWAQYAHEGDFELREVGGAAEHEGYLSGQGYGRQPEPEALEVITATLSTFDRGHEDAKLPDLGDLDGPLPEHVDVVLVGAGISGIYQAAELVKSGKTIVLLERYHMIGGVWQFYGNEYSRVNTSEIGYRIVDKTGPWKRPNEDHTPRRDILKDMYTMASECKGMIRCSINVEKVRKQPDGTFEVLVKSVKTGKEATIRADIVSFHTNRRIGRRREVDWENSKAFKGNILYGYGNEVRGMNFWGKEVLVVGAGAFAFENVRTSLEHGARFVTMLGRRDGTTSPKWIDMISFLRPLDEQMGTSRSGNMISFECWQRCYHDAGLRPPQCWADGLLKPNNHTVSVSDLAFIGCYHGMFETRVGEIARIVEDGSGVELKDGWRIPCQIILKCTGFHLSSEVRDITGYEKMQPYGLLDMNLHFQAEPLLDGGQFASAKDHTESGVEDVGFSPEDYAKGLRVFRALGFNQTHLKPVGNPFGSGNGGPVNFEAKYFAWLVNNPSTQQALLDEGGKAEQDVQILWASQIAQYSHLVLLRLIASLAKLKV